MQRESRLRFLPGQWKALTEELHRRTQGQHEAGAFLLGRCQGERGFVSAFVFYDELDPDAYETGICVLRSSAFRQLWNRCEAWGLKVVADVHVHPWGAAQSPSDKENPMIARPGHFSIILPWMARAPIDLQSVGIYEYLGAHQWRALGGRNAYQILKVGNRE